MSTERQTCCGAPVLLCHFVTSLGYVQQGASPERDEIPHTAELGTNPTGPLERRSPPLRAPYTRSTRFG
jgi:hypothetical protein